MRILFIHQSFPGQYRHLVRALSAARHHQIVALGTSELTEPLPPAVTYVRYPLLRSNSVDAHNPLLDIDSKVIRAESCAHAAVHLRSEGFHPDLICAHPGWGESLYMRDIWPSTPILSYQEFFYNPIGYDFDFDPELQGIPDWQACTRLRLKNLNPLLVLETSDWNVSPTHFQKSTFPTRYHQRISVIHDGINVDTACPLPVAYPFILPDQTSITENEPVITFVNRRIEPYRGCHTFIRAIPYIQEANPTAHIVLVGNTEGVSYGAASEGISWKDTFLSEIDGHYNRDKVHFVGTLDHASFTRLLQASSCHVYLTYPFVLSWSLLEAMSIGLPIVASDTAPVTEVIQDHHNGLLTNFFNPTELAQKVSVLLEDRSFASDLGQNARQTILDGYTLNHCVPRHLSLMQLVASRALQH